jgi:hypothetical protein
MTVVLIKVQREGYPLDQLFLHHPRPGSHSPRNGGVLGEPFRQHRFPRGERHALSAAHSAQFDAEAFAEQHTE